MKRYILIGGIGSGKSTVSMLFAEHGAFCIDLDIIGHRQLLVPEVIDELTRAFGKHICDERGRIDRSSLATVAFSSPENTAQLNAITHPHIIRVVQEKLARAKAAGSTVAIAEVSAFTGPEGSFAPLVKESDGIIAVVAPEDVRIARACQRAVTEEDVRRRIARQPSDEQREAWATYIIPNAGTKQELEVSVDKLWSKLV